MKAPHQPITGHDLLAVERFRDDTRHMAEFSVLADCSLGREGQYLRRFLSEDSYAQVLDAQRQGHVYIHKHADIIEGHIMPPKPKRRRHKQQSGGNHVYC